MIEMEMPKDIRQYKTKLIGPFSTREFVCFTIAAGCGLLTFNTVGKIFVSDVRIFLCIVSAIPGLLCGWYKPYGVPFEKFIKSTLIAHFLSPAKRKYVIENRFNVKKVKKKLTSKERKEIKKKTKELKLDKKNELYQSYK